MSPNKRQSLEDWLGAVFQATRECPPPERFLSREFETLPSEERKRIETHVNGCPACAAERDVAAAFDAAPEASAASSLDLHFVTRRLSGSPAGHRRRYRIAVTLGLATAATVLLASMVALLGSRERVPPLPPVPGAGVAVRGSVVRIRAPIGEIPRAPEKLQWEAFEGAGEYAVALKRADGTKVWSGTVVVPEASLPSEVRGRIDAFVVYSWQVEALGEGSRKIAWSEWARFQVIP